MRVVDLTHFIAEDMPVYPGTEGPKISQATTIATEGFAEKLITMYSHTGTHMDAPGHIVAGAQTLDALDAGRFVGPATIIDVSGVSGALIGADLIRSAAGAIEKKRFVIFRSGWAKLWGQDAYYDGFPVLTEDAARLLCEFDLSGIGLDMISVDRVGSKDFPIHNILFRRGFVVIENLADLDGLGISPFTFCCLPLKIPSSDGSPVRAVAILD